MKKPYKTKIPSLKGWKWVDSDMHMLHVCFTILERFIEDEDPFNYHVWEEKDKKEILELYYWWKNYKNKEEELDELLGQMDYKIEKNKDGSLRILSKTEQSKIIGEKYTELENKLLQEEDEMLRRLIEIRGHMWT